MALVLQKFTVPVGQPLNTESESEKLHEKSKRCSRERKRSWFRLVVGGGSEDAPPLLGAEGERDAAEEEGGSDYRVKLLRWSGLSASGHRRPEWLGLSGQGGGEGR